MRIARLALLRFMGGKKVPPQIQRMRSDDLLASVFPDVAACQENIAATYRFRTIRWCTEVMKDVLHEAMDIDGLKQVLGRYPLGAISASPWIRPCPRSSRTRY